MTDAYEIECKTCGTVWSAECFEWVVAQIHECPLCCREDAEKDPK